MNKGKTVFSQLMSFFPWYEFDKCVKKYDGDYKVHSFTCRQQFMVMCFAQLTGRESLRDIEACLNAVPDKLYHSGFRAKIRKSTMADANESRDWRIFADFAQVLIPEARSLYQNDNDFKVEINNMVYALDSTSIELCLSLFPWAKFREHKGAVKAHTVLDLRGSIPTIIKLTDGLCHDVNILDELEYEPGAFYIMDRGYVDFKRLFRIHKSGAFFVTRAKRGFDFVRIDSRKVNKKTGLICDQTIRANGFYTSKDYPDTLRRIRYHDKETDKSFVFLTNSTKTKSLIITQLYKERWKIELFFKCIKQNLRIKVFYGTSRNAVYLQIWIAVCVYLLLAIIKAKLKIKIGLHTMSQVLEFCIFEKTPLNQLFSDEYLTDLETEYSNQLTLFDL
jgi:hypothetical protein